MTLAIGPANYAGQAHAWARAAQRHLGVDATSFAYRTRPFRLGPGPAFAFPSDRVFPHPKTLTPMGRRMRLRSLTDHSHVMLDGFVPIGSPPGEAIDSDISYLSERSTKVALISHGSDLRHPDRHREAFLNSYFDHAEVDWVKRMRRLVERNQTTLESYSELPLFVSTPDQLLLYPKAIWLPLSVNTESFEASPSVPLSSRVPKVLHIPTRRNPPIKGTHLIDPVMRKLEAEGKLQYVSPETVSHDQMLRLMSECDIVIDQILTGAYGVTAVEAMSMGRLVIGGVSEDVRSRMPESPPIVEAAPETLESLLLEIVGSPSLFADRAQLGRAFARRWHDGRAAAEAMRMWLEL